MKPVVFCDFDGTVTAEDVQHVILNHYAGEAWIPVNEAWRRFEITTEERCRRQWALVHATESDLAQLAARVPLDPGFRDFVTFCHEQGYDLRIVSDGFDFYIRRLLEVHGLSDIPFYANHLSFQGSHIELSFSRPNPGCCTFGNCKRLLVEGLRPPGGRAIYVGDGLSDRCGAEAADLVFAKGLLASYLEQKGLPFHPFRHFGDVTAALRGLERRDGPIQQ